jgi:hypothetical protein
MGVACPKVEKLPIGANPMIKGVVCRILAFIVSVISRCELTPERL